MRLQNKVAIVTGASSGIGLAVARLFAKEGASVVLASRSKEKLKAITKTIPHSLCMQTDMTKENQIARMVKKTVKQFGRIDILVNNAGQGYDAPVEDIDIKTFHYIFDLNLVGPLCAMQQVIPFMKKQKDGGNIVNISSGTALMILQSMGAYASLKQALAKISLTAREELEKNNVRVSVMYPFITATDFEKNTIRQKKYRDVYEPSDNFELPKADPPEYVAELVLDGMLQNKAEIMAHDWMGK